MRIGLLKLEEAGAEEVTTIEGNEQPAEKDVSDMSDEEYEAWLNDDQDDDDDEIDEEVPVDQDDDEEKEEEETKEDEPQEKDEEDEEKAPEENILDLKISKGEIKHDLNDKDLTVRMLQQGYDAQQKWQEAAAIKNQSYKFMEALKANPREILENPALGIDIVALSEAVLYDKLEEENMTPAERKLRDENRALKAAERKRELEAQQAEAKAQKERSEGRNKSIQETIQNSGIPLTQDNFNRAVRYMQQAEEAGIPDVTPQMVMDYVRRDFLADQQAFVRTMNVEQLEELLGKDLLESVRKHKLEKIAPKKKVPVKAKPAPKKEQPKKYGDITSFLQRR